MPDSIEISLESYEFVDAATIGMKRNVQNILKKHNSGTRPVEEGWRTHIEGACGEKAFAKYQDKYYAGVIGDRKCRDVGEWEVRTAKDHDYCLLIYEGTHQDTPCVLLTGMAPHFVIRGWILAKEGQKHELWKDPKRGRPAFFVPQSMLRSFNIKTDGNAT